MRRKGSFANRRSHLGGTDRAMAGSICASTDHARSTGIVPASILSQHGEAHARCVATARSHRGLGASGASYKDPSLSCSRRSPCRPPAAGLSGHEQCPSSDGHAVCIACTTLARRQLPASILACRGMPRSRHIRPVWNGRGAPDGQLPPQVAWTRIDRARRDRAKCIAARTKV